MKLIYHREIGTFEIPHIVVRPNGREILATHFILSTVSVDNGAHWYYLGEETDYPCSSFTHAKDMLDEFEGRDSETEYVMNPIIWDTMEKEEVKA